MTYLGYNAYKSRTIDDMDRAHSGFLTFVKNKTFMTKSNVFLMMTPQPMYIQQTGSFTSKDITMCSPSHFMDCTWSVTVDRNRYLLELLKDFPHIQIYKNIILKRPTQDRSFVPTISWQECVSKLNVRTSVNKCWDMIRKMKVIEGQSIYETY